MACGPGGIWDRLIPDRLFGCDISEACWLHDWLWGGPGGRTKWDCDNLFLIALITIVQRHAGGRRWRYLLCHVYFWAVYLGGWTIWWGERRKERKFPYRASQMALNAERLMRRFGLLRENEPYDQRIAG